MHFIGNRAIVLGQGEPGHQLVYDSGYTVLSVFLPIVGLTIAFSAAEIPVKRKSIRTLALLLTGVFAGLSIVGMHYIGNFGIANYRLFYNPRYLAASAVISVGSCLTVLVLFYNAREKWISSWWKRVLCAMALAVGVSAMHFTASTSCRYVLKRAGSNTSSEIKSRDIQVIVAGALCGTAALLVLGVLCVTRARNRVRKSRSQKVMLACALFDSSGRILVTTEGVLPSREITDKYRHRTFDEDFDTAHPVFQWIFRVTHHWSAVSELIPKMKSHLAAERETVMPDSHSTNSQSSAVYDAETYNDYELIFREQFCAAAQSLATSVHLPLEQLGVLYDKIIETGTLEVDETARKRMLESSGQRTMAEVEAALQLHLCGKGQLLFITRELTEHETSKLLNTGFRFANVQHVGKNIAHAMQIPQATLEGYTSDLKRYVGGLQTPDKSGTYLTFFAMIPKPNVKGFDIAVKKDSQNQLPDVPLLNGQPLPWQAAFLEKLDGKTASRCIQFCNNRGGAYGSRTCQEQQFAVVVAQAIIALTYRFPAEWRNDAKFWSKQLYAHYSHPLQIRSMTTTLYAFTVIGDMHASIQKSDTVTRVPRTFFTARHRCYAGSPDHAVLAQDIHAAFGPLWARKVLKQSPHHHLRGKISLALSYSPIHAISSKLHKFASNGKLSSSEDSSQLDHTDDCSSMRELVDKPRSASGESYDSENVHAHSTEWGGILVNSETVVKTNSKSDLSITEKGDADFAMGIKVACETAKPEMTFVDELVMITRERFLPATKGSAYTFG